MFHLTLETTTAVLVLMLIGRSSTGTAAGSADSKAGQHCVDGGPTDCTAILCSLHCGHAGKLRISVCHQRSAPRLTLTQGVCRSHGRYHVHLPYDYDPIRHPHDSVASSIAASLEDLFRATKFLQRRTSAVDPLERHHSLGCAWLEALARCSPGFQYLPSDTPRAIPENKDLHCWMMEDTIDDTSECSIDVFRFIVHTLDDLRDYPLEDLGSDLSGRFVQNL